VATLNILHIERNSCSIWQYLALAVPVWYFKPGRGFALVKFQDFISFAGDSDRDDIHYFVFTPALYWRLGNKYWMVADSETQTVWKTDRTSVKSGLLFGRVLSKRFAFWVKPEIPWGPNRQGDWNLEFTLLWVK
jgi:hypothetical protein